MANSTKPRRRIIKKSETIRTRTSKPKSDRPKRRVLRNTASRVVRPLRYLAPLAKPFKVKPVRKIAGIIGRVLWPKFFRGAWKELRQVTWPGRKETWKLTLSVFVFALVFGILVTVIDFGLDKLFKQIILK